MQVSWACIATHAKSVLGVHSGVDLKTFGFGKDRKPQVKNVKLQLPEAPFPDIELGLVGVAFHLPITEIQVGNVPQIGT